jgi:predicted O-methyltransferase YrrM
MRGAQDQHLRATLDAGPAQLDQLPPQLAAVEEATGALGFNMASDRATGMLLRTLAASKPGGSLLELGTGTGLATAWLLDGMDSTATLLSVDNDAGVQALAAHYCGDDPRLSLVLEDGDTVLPRLHAAGARFDLIFADTWPGKYRLLDLALDLLKPGAFYVIDDLLPQTNWPPNHGTNVAQLIQDLQGRPDLWLCQLDWSSGLLVAAKR